MGWQTRHLAGKSGNHASSGRSSSGSGRSDISRRSLGVSMRSNTRYSNSWVIRQGKFKREPSDKERCEKSSLFWDKGRLITRHKIN